MSMFGLSEVICANCGEPEHHHFRLEASIEVEMGYNYTGWETTRILVCPKATFEAKHDDE